MNLRHKAAIGSAFAALLLLAVPFVHTPLLRAQGSAREFTINGDQFAFAPVRIEVQKDDLVKITFNARDIAHSFTIDQYRIAKRAGAGQSVTFEFRADQVGTFPFYCNITSDDACRDMKGTLVVAPR